MLFFREAVAVYELRTCVPGCWWGLPLEGGAGDLEGGAPGAAQRTMASFGSGHLPAFPPFCARGLTLPRPPSARAASSGSVGGTWRRCRPGFGTSASGFLRM